MRAVLASMWLSLAAHLGAVLGMIATSLLLTGPALERYAAEHGGERPCGTFPAPYDFLGIGVGFLAGGWIGWRSSRRWWPGWWRTGATKTDAEPG